MNGERKMDTISEKLEETTASVSEDVEEIMNLLDSGKTPKDAAAYLKKINKIATLVKRAYEELASE